jgi:hypothetical protein
MEGEEGEEEEEAQKKTRGRRRRWAPRRLEEFVRRRAA